MLWMCHVHMCCPISVPISLTKRDKKSKKIMCGQQKVKISTIFSFRGVCGGDSWSNALVEERLVFKYGNNGWG